MGEKKRVLRAAVLSQRDLLSSTEFLALSGLIQKKLLGLPHYFLARSVGLYSPIQNEVGTDEIRDHALEEGKDVYYPRVGQDKSVELVQIRSAGELEFGRFGVPEPSGDKRLGEEDKAGLIVIVPGVVFDPKGNRVGRGQGGYDRLLKGVGEQATFIGLAYEFQIVEEVPAEVWDQRVHYIITERRLIDCAASPSHSNQVW